MIHSYVIEHDVGFAPNPFHGVCTLAACKPRIRLRASIGDLILGFGSAKHGYARHLVYWMRVDRIISFDEYWAAPEFASKKPDMNASLMHIYGDNIYHLSPDGKTTLQEHSFHSSADGSVDVPNLERDTKRTSKVLIGKDFLYFGRNAVRIPSRLRALEKVGIGESKCADPSLIKCLNDWIASLSHRGFRGRPIDWHPIQRKAPI